MEPVLPDALEAKESGANHLKNRLLKNGLYNTGAGVIRIGLALLTVPMLIRLMGIEEYGLWALASAVIALVALAEAGLSTTTTVFVSQDLGEKNIDSLSQTLTVTFVAILFFATVASIGLWSSAAMLVSFFPKLDQTQQFTLTQALKIGGLIIGARLIQPILVGIEQAYQRYDLLNILNTLYWLLSSMGLVVIATFGGQTVALMQCQAAVALGGLLSHILAVRFLTYRMPLRFTWSSERSLAIAKYSVFTWLTALGGALFVRGDRVVVGALLGSKTLGVYAAMADVAGAISLFSTLPVQPLLPTLSKLAVKPERDRESLYWQIKQALSINTLAATGLGTFLFTLSPLVMQIMLDDEANSENITAFRLAIVIYTLFSINAVGYYILFSANKVRQNMLIHLLSGALSLVLISIGSHYFYLSGAIFGNIGYLCIWLLTIYGMNCLSIPKKIWLDWIKFPLLCFAGFVVTSFFFMNQFYIILCLGTVQLFALAKWFTDAQPEAVNLLTQRFRTEKN